MLKKTATTLLTGIALLALLLAGCSPTAAQDPTAAVTVQPTDTLVPTETNTPTATLEPTPLPGEVVIPLESLQYGFPWLPVDRVVEPMLVYYGFNVTQPPFDVPEVRQAFALALDSTVLTEIYTTSGFYNNEVAARTIIPAQTLSLDVSGEIGLPYDPARAKELLTAAGYSDPAAFPATKLLIIYPKYADYPGIMVNAATEAIRMWQENLGVTVDMEVKGLEGENMLQQQRDLIQSGEYQIFEHGVWANNNDPDEFFSGLFTADGYNNLTGYVSEQVTSLIRAAAGEVDPAKRLPIYLELERLLSEQELPIIPFMHCTVDTSGW
jgi:dipeptide transport system substrate-binding protein